MGRSSVAAACLFLLILPACDPRKPTGAAAESGSPRSSVGKSGDGGTPAIGDAGRDARLDAEHDAPPDVAPPKHYKTVVHTGDSMVGGGLCKALAPRFKADGAKFVRDVWESASIMAFDESDRIPTLMKRYHPDLVLLTLGANDVFNDHPEYMAKHIESIVKKIGHRDCVWIGPPLWKGDKGLVEVIRAHAAPCRFYDSQHLVLARAGDGIHPTEKGGEVWADALWPFLKGDGDAGP
jgi:lysophospholipase L1-like esterase